MTTPVRAIDWFTLVSIALFGALFGSFVGVIVERLPKALSEPNDMGELWDTNPWREVLGGRSVCADCDTQISPWDNIPIVSWLVLRGRCRSCSAPFGVRLLVLELLLPIVAVATFWAIGWESRLALAWWLAPVGLAVAAIDLRTLMVPTRIVWPAAFVALAIGVVLALAEGEPGWLVGGVVGCAVFAGPLFSIWWIHPRGMGFGDVRLAVLLGWSVGIALAPYGLRVVALGVLVTIVMSAVLGATAGFAAVGFRRHIPFGPAMVAATLIAISFADRLADGFVG